MGQQCNLQTLRVFDKNVNLLTSSPQEFVNGLNFLKYFQQFFYRKNVILARITLNFIGNKCLLTLCVFIRHSRAKIYLKKLKKGLKPPKFSALTNPSTPFRWKTAFSEFLSKNLRLLGFNICCFKFNLLNPKLQLNKGFLRLLYRINKKYIEQLFSRRNPLFFDFLKISCLFSRGAVSANTFLFILGQIFRFLLKRKHSRFFHFVKKNFKALILPKDLRSEIRSTTYRKQNKLLGLKLTIAGRLKGKLRSNEKCFIFGRIPNQSVSKKIEFAQTEVFTRYGVFGLKLSTHLKI